MSLTALFIVYYQSGIILGLICSLVILAIHHLDREWKWVSQIGVISYSIYLIHVLFGGRLLLLTQKFVGDELLKSLLILVYLVMTIVAAWIFYKFIERPFLLFSKSISYKTKATKKFALSSNL